MSSESEFEIVKPTVESQPLSCRFAGLSCFLCFATSFVAIFLLLSILFVLLDVPHGFQSVSLRTLTIDVYWTTVVPVISFIADIVKSLFPWPVLVLAGIALVAWGPQPIREILSAAKIELPGGIKFEPGKAATYAFKKELGDAQKSVTRANREIEEAYVSAKAYVAQLRAEYGIDLLVSEMSKDVAAIIGEKCPEDYRFTLYVPDLVFSDRLYQLVEYYDRLGHQLTNGRSGRTFSIRYGIIGRVWRSGVAEVEGELISADDRRQLKQDTGRDALERFIARRWGLTLDEAFRIKPYQSYGAIRLYRAEKSLGVLFFDSKEQNAFGDQSVIEMKIQALVEKSSLTQKLLEISREVTPWSRIQIFRNS